MKSNLALADYAVFIIYFIVVSVYGYTVYRKRKQDEQDAKAYFLAEGNLTWWAIGASLIASNISAEQFIGMSGEGFFLGIAVAAYEWLAAIALIIVAVWFIPVYLKNKIYTMPQFLKTRYNESTALIMAVFWLFLYVFVNLTSILYLGAVAINGLAGGEYLHIIMIGLAVFALFISLGGMKVVAYTDVIQVAVLIIGGLVTSYIALTTVGQYFGVGENAIAGFKVLMKEAPEHFKMIIPKPTASSSQLEIDKYLTFPGLLSYAAGIWIINLNYWGCNQYITQRALGADLQTARTGILFAGMLKLLMPLIVMLPGIAAYVLYTNGHLPQLVGGKDGAYSAVLTFLPTGLKGLSVAALTAAIVASLAGKVNSISTIYTLDIHKKYIQKEAGEKQQVNIGRLAVFAAMLLAVLFTWNDILGIGGVGGFTYIQKYTGFISPGVFAMFFLGMFWKRTTGAAAIVGVILGFVLSVLFNEYAPALFGNDTLLYTAYPNGKGAFEIPFHICMGLSFFFTMLVMILMSFAGPKVNPKAFETEPGMFKVKPQTTVLIVITMLIIIALYVKFW
ncbi:sodium/sugar symporter [Flavobacterium johnsoniae]|uniref:SSS sodium solute transporter superfamily n=1 Tax=Flavobacterium johnsoniae (strain ATCC 17061 / DSM 2064 / JCM 8514 / BCRC 14874 / CCUG 350202 / NBRC 14942 / NCIMB 11054 / UW101) TaxID=376686 RepID=A5FKW8_FLAJ1|nr:sodium/sugar symporter [Flavobacterium johnsoniae]ABQ04145.1 SSS sodium solute transporter superfamily [Flavobacterium johnsoniae UW101]OXG02623.1 sodium transporter [Flavobacterium johnsoniae UW101]WQG78985.1 sodium/sugar symporter [Flavobacterium johnsoniae UW101]SHK13648.1 solute:Na+ symporter, SSS family [Flavobacterium johnsoniae]